MAKTLKIGDDVHLKLKIYCAKNKLKINKFVENLISKKIDNEK